MTTTAEAPATTTTCANPACRRPIGSRNHPRPPGVHRAGPNGLCDRCYRHTLKYGDLPTRCATTYTVSTATMEDIEELIAWGEHPDMVAIRAGHGSRDSLYQRLRRCGRHDLIDVLTARGLGHEPRNP